MSDSYKNTGSSAQLDDGQINLKELLKIFWSARKFIILTTALFAVCSVGFSLWLTNYYKSESVLIVRSDSEIQGLSQYSGLAAMAGLTLPSAGNDKAAQVIELIKSRKFVKHLISFDDILPSIMAAKSYDIFTQKLFFDQELYDQETDTWKRKPKKDGSIIPSYLEAHEVYLGGMLTISQDKISGFISISIEHLSPVFAKVLLDLIIRESNELLRKKDMEESEQGLEYLTSALSKTPFADTKDSINTLIEAQLETQMLAKIHKDYILIEIEPPFIPEKKSKPSRALICILGTLLGGFLSILIVLIRQYPLTEKEKLI